MKATCEEPPSPPEASRLEGGAFLGAEWPRKAQWRSWGQDARSWEAGRENGGESVEVGGGALLGNVGLGVASEMATPLLCGGDK